MASRIKEIPKGFHTVTPYLTVSDSERAIDFYKRAFGAEELSRLDSPDGKVAHAEIKIGDSIIMLSDEMQGGDVRLSLWVARPSTSFSTSRMLTGFSIRPLLPAPRLPCRWVICFGGDRYGRVTDPFGHSWSLATHKEDVPADELRKRAEAAMSKPA